jgi:HSP20 family protein
MESMDRFVRDFFRDFRLDPSSGSCGETVDWSPPRIALTEHPKEIRLTVHVSGMSAKDIEVKLTGDRLILGGSKENEADDRRQHPKERTYGSFYRSLSLPTGIARDEVRAEIKDGILTLRMPKTEQARKSQRNVEVGQV